MTTKRYGARLRNRLPTIDVVASGVLWPGTLPPVRVIAAQVVEGIATDSAPADKGAEGAGKAGLDQDAFWVQNSHPQMSSVDCDGHNSVCRAEANVATDRWC
jgi:hypothetical protein